MNSEEIKVLYVDDEILNLRSFEILFSNKCRVFTASDGIKAIEILNNNDIDIVVSDQKMPKMSGVQLLRKVREIKNDIVRIIHSGFLDDIEVQSAIKDKTAAYLLDKPLNEHELINIINDYNNLRNQNSLL